MSTSANILIIDESGETIVNIYKYWDGDRFLHRTLLQAIEGATLHNGVTDPDLKAKKFAGMPCFAAYLIKTLKETAGDVYLHSIGNIDGDYQYSLFPKDNKIQLEVG